MAKNCGKCGKQVYPMDELKCLDKIWHKGCFKCQVCGMLLNMKNYKGFERMPYCGAHYPEIKHTQVAETPESKRIAENTKLQSQVKYHEEFEKAKGVKISVADDPETVRVRKNMQTISQAAYHGELEKKMQMEDARPGEYEVSNTMPAANQTPPPANRRQPGSITDYDPMGKDGVGASPFSSRTQATVVFNSTQGGNVYKPAVRQVGSIADYDPLNERYGSIVSQYQAGAPPAGSAGPPAGSAGPPAGYGIPAQPYMPPAQAANRQSGYTAPQSSAPSAQAVKAAAALPAAAPAPRDVFAGKGRVCEAIYDYDAGDNDEISFHEYDLIINCDPVDEGWMVGTLESTGKRGMLPANYVKKVNWE